MAMVINTNLGSINGQRNLSSSGSSLSTSMQRLSSGIRVNNAKDDAAGLAIADRMTSQVRGMTVAVRNANDGISLTQSTEGALGSLTDTLQRMRDLAVQSSSNAGVSATDREKLQTEFRALNDELTRIVQNSEFNGKKVLNGDLSTGLDVQIGATTDKNSRISITVPNMATILTSIKDKSLNPKNESVDATFFAATVNKVSSVITQDADLKTANDAAKAANAAVVAAKLAMASPTDHALAVAAALANKDAAQKISDSSTRVLAIAQDNKSKDLVPQAFLDAVTVATSSNVNAAPAIGVTYDAVNTGTTTDSAQAASLLTTATQLAQAGAANVESMGKNIFESSMSDITGDTLSNTSNPAGGTLSTLDGAIKIAQPGTFKADRVAQRSMAALDVAKAVASASYVNDPTQTQSANDVNKASFILNHAIVQDTSKRADSVSAEYALSAIDAIDNAIASVDTVRSDIGSTQNRFTTTISNLQNGIENQSAAKSRIMDADFAQETANLSRSQILQQAGTAMLAQANQSGQGVLTLLR
jgi:flagellin